jgi:DNA-binding NtrC family response regulator
VLTIRLPPLRERKDDVPLLVEHFLKLHSPQDRRPKELAPGVMDLLTAYAWPGNIRELENEVKRMVTLGDDVIQQDVLSEQVRGPAGFSPPADSAEVQNLLDLVEQVERREIQKAIAVAQGNKTRAADLLGISRFTLQRNLEKYAMGD